MVPQAIFGPKLLHICRVPPLSLTLWWNQVELVELVLLVELEADFNDGTSGTGGT